MPPFQFFKVYWIVIMIQYLFEFLPCCIFLIDVSPLECYYFTVTFTFAYLPFWLYT